MATDNDLNPHFPVVKGRHQLTATWSVDLPGEFNRRVEEDGDLVLWRPGMTVFVAIWNNDRAESVSARIDWLREDTDPSAFDIVADDLGTTRRFAYRQSEDSDDDRVPALYAFTVAEDSHVQLAVYFDSERDVETALRLWRSVLPARRSGSDDD
jgi:hypothetical protein